MTPPCVPVLEEAVLVESDRLSPEIVMLGLRAPQVARRIAPGQFVMLRVPWGEDLVLRRPFGFHGLLLEEGMPAGIRLLVREVGKGTRRLASLKPGTPIPLLGPCGRGFTPPGPGERPVLVAAGIGAAPLGPLLESVKGSDPIIFYGARTAAELVWRPGPGTRLATDDGSAGFAGTLVDLVGRDLPGLSGALRWYVCGPIPFMAALVPLLAYSPWPVEVALDRRMACGFGVCLGCVVPVTGGGESLRACTDGPVFDARIVDWDRLSGEQR